MSRRLHRVYFGGTLRLGMQHAVHPWGSGGWRTIGLNIDACWRHVHPRGKVGDKAGGVVDERARDGHALWRPATLQCALTGTSAHGFLQITSPARSSSFLPVRCHLLVMLVFMLPRYLHAFHHSTSNLILLKARPAKGLHSGCTASTACLGGHFNVIAHSASGPLGLMVVAARLGGG